jgi:hypothetical protein
MKGVAGSGAAVPFIAGFLIGGVLFGSFGADVFNLPALFALLVRALGMGIGNGSEPAHSSCSLPATILRCV